MRAQSVLRQREREAVRRARDVDTDWGGGYLYRRGYSLAFGLSASCSERPLTEKYSACPLAPIGAVGIVTHVVKLELGYTVLEIRGGVQPAHNLENLESPSGAA